MSIRINPMRKRGFLTVAIAALGLALAAPAAQAAQPGAAGPSDGVSTLAKPEFLAPFECESEWTYSTYGSHDPHVADFIRSDGKPDLGSPVLASADGTATRAYEDGGAGQYIIIEHADGWRTEYMHLDEYSVEDGTEVKQGDQVGTVGSTGGSTGPHLHLQHKLNGELQNIELEGEALAPYPPEYGQKFITSTNGCDGGGEPEPPEQKDTALAYTGPATVSNGSPAELSATLTEKEGAAPVAERPVSISLGAEDAAQTCEGTTDADGVATCTVDAVKQPLNDKGTVPVTAAFAGDDEFTKSEVAAEVKLQHVSGRAFGLSADAPLLGLPLAIKPTPDTGEVRTADAETKKPACAQNINALVLSADALCADVTTKTGPSSATSTATVADATVGLPGLPVVAVSGLTATSTSSCTDTEGSTKLTLSIAGTPVTVPDTPNHTVDLGVGAKIVTNEQVETADGLTVNALHLTAPGGIDVVIASSTSAAHNCA